jgi:hypothetical protein
VCGGGDERIERDVTAKKDWAFFIVYMFLFVFL